MTAKLLMREKHESNVYFTSFDAITRPLKMAATIVFCTYGIFYKVDREKLIPITKQQRILVESRVLTHEERFEVFVS